VTNGGTVVNGNITFTETTVAARALTNKANFTSTRYVGPDAIQVAFDADGSTAYEFVVAYDDGVNSGGVQFFDRRIHVMSMSHSTLRTVDDGYTAQMRGDIEELGTYNGAASIDDLVKSGPFITLGPGLNILWVDLWSLAAVAYDSVDPRDALAKQDAAQSTTVTVDVIPRYWG
jgi:hypothetical protein